MGWGGGECGGVVKVTKGTVELRFILQTFHGACVDPLKMLSIM